MEKEEPGILIRRATRDDVAEIVRLLADDPLGSQRERYARPLPEVYYDAFREIERDPSNELVVVEADGEVIGTMQLTFIPGLSAQGAKRAQVEAVRIDGAHRGRGIGNRLLEWAIDRAREEGCRSLQLTTHKSRLDAQRFYLRLGFVASHEGMKLDLSRRPPPS